MNYSNIISLRNFLINKASASILGVPIILTKGSVADFLHFILPKLLKDGASAGRISLRNPPDEEKTEG